MKKYGISYYLRRIISRAITVYNRLLVFIPNSIYLSSTNYINRPKCNGLLYIKNQGSIFFDDNIILNSTGYNVIGGDQGLNLITNKSGTIKIGCNVGISNSTLVSHNLIEIENNVLIGGGCKIYDTDFHSIDSKNRMQPYIEKKKDLNILNAPVKISKNVWIGGHCIILKGVTIGENSIIAAGSVVTKNVPEFEIWGGNPAKFIRNIKHEKNE